MAVNFLHGVETIEVVKGARPIRVVKSAVIGLVGIAPKGPKQQLIAVNNDVDAAQFGSQLPGFNIPQALDIISKQGGATVVVINVFDPATMCATVTNETQTITAGKAKLAFAPIQDLVVTNNAGDVTYVLNTDYTVDEYGNIQVIGTSISESSTIKATYKKLDASAITSSVIVGTITSGVRTGMKLFQESMATLGYTPRLFIAPNYSTLSAVAAELSVVANKYKGHCFIDAPVGTTVAQAISGRGPAGTINFNTSDKRSILCYPHLKISNPDPRIPDTDANKNYNFPFSAFFAGVVSYTDNNFGYWYSPSNKLIKGATGVERRITAALNDASTDANQLNEQGICTQFSAFGTGLRTWGNRSAAYPSSTHPSNFIVVQRVADIIHESIELAMLPFIDEPINTGLIDSIVETVNSFLNTLVGRGALILGSKCIFDPAKNPPTEIAAGHLTFDLSLMPPTPAERITFESFIDISLLKNLVA